MAGSGIIFGFHDNDAVRSAILDASIEARRLIRMFDDPALMLRQIGQRPVGMVFTGGRVESLTEPNTRKALIPARPIVTAAKSQQIPFAVIVGELKDVDSDYFDGAPDGSVYLEIDPKLTSESATQFSGELAKWMGGLPVRD